MANNSFLQEHGNHHLNSGLPINIKYSTICAYIDSFSSYKKKEKKKKRIICVEWVSMSWNKASKFGLLTIENLPLRRSDQECKNFFNPFSYKKEKAKKWSQKYNKN